MTLDPKVIGELVIAAALVAINLPPIIAWLRSKMPDKPAPQAPDPNAKTGDARSPGDVLDCLRCDMEWLLANTDATDADVASIESAAKFLIHVSKPKAKAAS